MSTVSSPVQSFFSQSEDRETFVRQKAFDELTSKSGAGSSVEKAKDVDCQALGLLEDAMFARKFNPKIRSMRQWGLDIGVHQNNWDPYAGHDGDYDDLASDLKVSPPSVLTSYIYLRANIY